MHADAHRRSTSVIVGGSAGIGLAIAEQFAACGHDVVIAARGEQRLGQAVAELTRRFGEKSVITGHVLDATAPDAGQFLADIVGRCGGRKYLVLAAADWQAIPMSEIAPAQLRRAAVANVLAPLELVRSVLPHLEPGDGILVVGSLAGCFPMPWMNLYSASKAHLHAAILGLRQELHDSGIKISLLAPGAVLTDFIPRQGGSRWRWAVDLAASSPDTVARAGRLGLLADQAFIVPGLLWRLGWIGSRLVPAGLQRHLARLALAPMASGRAANSTGQRTTS